MNNKLESFDLRLLQGIRKISLPLARIAIFTVFFWFGILKIFALGPANPLVSNLLESTLPFISFDQFIIIFGLYEMVIGIVFLFPGLERLAIALLMPHMVMTILPLILLPAVTWTMPFVPTLEGQYIIKNLVIIALAFSLASHLRPLSENSKTA
jgi:uncharacterized membrane protein YkgB